MEFHIKAQSEQISRYILCPGSQRRAARIAERFDDMEKVADDRGIVVYTGYYKGVMLTSCGTGMGGPAVAICMEELANLGADTFVRVGSCGVFQDDQGPGDIIIASGTVREGGTANAYLPLEFPAVPSYEVLETLVKTANALEIPYTVGVGIAGDAFYSPRDLYEPGLLKKAGLVSVEMESDTLFIVGQFRGLRTGALYASDGTNNEIKPVWGEEKYLQGELDMITIALESMLAMAKNDNAG
ncbi:MAG: nucleoside phosphorylase, partial [Anaerolineaceae bacterium]|nr:nucleoside phosphorylase [Anaerolineaceae bacterium]